METVKKEKKIIIFLRIFYLVILLTFLKLWNKPGFVDWRIVLKVIFFQ